MNEIPERITAKPEVQQDASTRSDLLCFRHAHSTPDHYARARRIEKWPRLYSGREIKRVMIRRELFALRNTKVVGDHNQFMANPLIKYGLIK